MTVTIYEEDVHGQPLPYPIKFDKKLYDELAWIPKWIEDNYDYWLLIVGRNGEGKSYTAMRAATLLNRNFDIDNIVFTAADVERAVEKSKPGDVILFDESDEIARHGSSAVIQEFKRFAKRIRHKRLVIMMATTTLKDINWYFITRIRSVIYNFAQGVKDRGWYHYYTGEDQLAWLYHLAKDGSKVETKTQVYDKAFSAIKNGYLGRGGEMPFHIDMDEYDSRKFNATIDNKVNSMNQYGKKAYNIELLGNIQTSPRLKDKFELKDYMELFKVSDTTVYTYIRANQGPKLIVNKDIPGEI